MKFHQTSELPIGKAHQARKRTSKLAPLIALTILLTIPLYYPTLKEKLSDTTPVYDEPSDEPIKLPTISHLETPPISQNIDQNTNCSAVGCDDDGKPGGVAEKEVDHHQSPPPARKKHERPGKRKRPHHKEKINRKHINEDQASLSLGHNEDEKGQLAIKDRAMIRWQLLDDEQCDLFTGEWVPDPDGPYYTNDTCNAIQEHQNCLKFGRPDKGFLKWKWRPDDCEMPVFDPARFMEIVRGKSIAFVGDSVARNHMQSLICLLSRVADPVDLSGPLDQNKRYEYTEHDFNISMFWAPYLVRTEKMDPNDEKRPFKLYLDEFDENWPEKIELFDYVIISAGHWFFRPTYFYLDRRLVGCLYCPESNVTHHTTSYFSYRRAFRTALRAINAAGFGGVAFLRTFAPSHFEGAAWDKGGDCGRTRPYGRNEVVLEDYSLEMYLIQLEELRIAQKAGRRNGGRFRLFDATRAMLMRPDGHPSKYGHLQGTNQSFANDCVHWCLPGPIDAWNDFLQELLRREDIGDDR
ncbi:hypothetical protein CASFOL_011774 [Castilleja foliolosa]|uniref:Trichome birefringence-like N-terminal domain-containing protein n=1 Tax=Castilleja foliolosa TaxID=1961234 RepID=A0ABD3DP59_9LAMI